VTRELLARAHEVIIPKGSSGGIDDGSWPICPALPEAANKVPTPKVPDFVLRLAALYDKSLAAVAPRLGEKRAFNSAKAQIMLGWRPRPLEETVLDCARSLIATGVV